MGRRKSLLRRPYPVDEVRRHRVELAMRRLGMTNRELAAMSKTRETDLPSLISGRWLSRTAEERVAHVLGQDVEWLFPQRSQEELLRMREEQEEERRQTLRRREENLRRLGVTA